MICPLCNIQLLYVMGDYFCRHRLKFDGCGLTVPHFKQNAHTTIWYVGNYEIERALAQGSKTFISKLLPPQWSRARGLPQFDHLITTDEEIPPTLDTESTLKHIEELFMKEKWFSQYSSDGAD
jgi:hypothetical protein